MEATVDLQLFAPEGQGEGPAEGLLQEGPEGREAQTPQENGREVPAGAEGEPDRVRQEEAFSRERLEKLLPALEALVRHGQEAGAEQAPPTPPGEDLQVQARRRIEAHFQSLEHQAEELRQVFPGFDLRQELKNPVFAQLTAPGTGVSVEDAYYALHRQAIQAASMQVAAQKTAQKLASSIRSAARRPVENGTGGRAASVGVPDYRSATREQRDELKARIRSAAARGEKVYPGVG